MLVGIDKRAGTSYPAQSVTAGANAAAGNEAGTITVPAGERWLLLGYSVDCVQGITQTPWPRLVITDGAFVLSTHSGTAAQAVSTTCKHSWMPGGPTVGPSGLTTAVAAQGALPVGLVLEAGATLVTSTAGIGANTDYAAPVARYLKLPTA